MKQITIEIPDGKKAEWVNGVLTLMDDTPKDVMDRIKTFEDACRELGESNYFVAQYRAVFEELCDDLSLIAYMKLRIIAAALNGEWKPTFAKDEWRYFPCFYSCTKDEWDNISDDRKDRIAWRRDADDRFLYTESYNMTSKTSSGNSTRLAFKTEELAVYCGKQFIDIWVDFIC